MQSAAYPSVSVGSGFLDNSTSGACVRHICVGHICAPDAETVHLDIIPILYERPLGWSGIAPII